MKKMPKLEHKKSLKQLMKEQGTKPLRKFEDVFGKGAHLWESDEAFDAFLESIGQKRHEGAKA